MPQASITINAVAGSDIDLPINAVVQLDNQNIGGELSYKWELLDQPPGAVDALSSLVLQNPTFTPRKEGSYLVRLIVNEGLVTEQSQTVVASVVQLKTLERIPAAGEVLEADTADGWATSMNSLLRRVDTLLSDPGIIVGLNASGGILTRGQVVRATASSIIKTGLPGQETVPGFSLALATTLAQLDELLCVVEGGVDGSGSVANLGLLKVRYIGRLASQTPGGVAAVGDTVYVSDAGGLSLTVGTIRRRVGSAMSAGATFDVWFNGVGGADIDLTPIDRAYLVHGNPGTLPNAIRTDDTNATVSTVGFRFSSGAVGTVPLTAKGFAGQTAALQRWLSSANVVLAQVNASGQFEAPSSVTVGLTARGVAGQTANILEVLNSAGTLLSAIDADGDLFFNAAARRVQWPDWYFFENASNEVRLVSAGDTGSFFSFVNISSGVTESTGLYAQTASGPIFGVVARGSAHATSPDTIAIVGGAYPLEFDFDGTVQWEMADDGLSLSSISKARIININRPSAVADVVATEYLFEVVALRNPAINSGFEFWQRGTSMQDSHTSGANVWDRTYAADRWYGGTVSDVAACLGAVNVSRQAMTGSASVTDYALRLGYATNGLVDTNAKVAIVQELDRRLVKQLRGKILNLSAYLQNVDFNSGPVYTLKIVTGTGSEGEWYTSGYTGAATPATTSAEIASTLSSGGNWTRVSAQSSAIGSTVTCMALVLEVSSIGDDGGTTDGNMEMAQVLLSESISTLLPPWQRCGESYAAELELCEFYFQKSYPLETAPGAASSLNMFNTHFLNVSTASGGKMVLGAFPQYTRRMREIAGLGYVGVGSTVRLYDAAGTIDSWNFGGGVQAVIADTGTNTDQTTFTVLNNAGGAYNPGSITQVRGHWIADHEI
jgi:hypothetical protein